MHYCALLITKEFPSENEIDEIMAPFYIGEARRIKEEGTGDYPIFTFDWYQIGGRYNGALKLKVDEKDDYYEWEYSTEGRNERLFYSYLLTEMKNFAGDSYRVYLEEKYYRTMGLRDGFLYVDGAKVDDLLNFDTVDCYLCIDLEGNVIVRDSAEDAEFDEKLAEIKKNSKGCFVTVLDIHD